MTHFIYISGLGDGYDFFRRLMVFLWQLRPGITSEVIPMRWRSEETYEEKLSRVNHAIEKVKGSKKIVLVGESAGGSIALLAFMSNARIVDRVVAICGKIRNADTIGSRYSRNHPALIPAVTAVDTALEAHKILFRRVRCIYTSHDEVVSVDDSVIPHADVVKTDIHGHLRAIMLIGFFRFDSLIKHKDVDVR